MQQLDEEGLPTSSAQSSHIGREAGRRNSQPEVRMSATLPYEDAVDLLDADHKLDQKLFLDYQGLCDDGAPSEARRQLVLRSATISTP